MNHELTYLPIHRVHRDDGANVRTHYDEAKAIELKESVRMDGVIQSLLVTPRADGDYDLCAGFRRHRATELVLADLAELDTEEARALSALRQMLPCMIVTAHQARLQMIENLQREQLDPVDEARGFRRALTLRDDQGELLYPSQRALSEAIGKGTTPHYVSRRLKLLDAPDFLLDAIRAGTPVGIGERIGAMASIKDREEMARLALKHPELGIPMTDAQVGEMIRKRFCRPLVKCGFDLSQADLLSETDKKLHGHTGAPGEDNDGSCDRCLLRSGNAPDFSTGDSDTVSPWMCQNPRCFEQKLAAQWQIMKGRIEDEGNRYLTPATAAGLLEKGVLVSEAYVAKEHRPGYAFTGHHAEEEMPTWEEIFTGEKVSWLVGQVPGKKSWCYLLEAAKALEIAEAKWKREQKPNLFANRPGKVGGDKGEVKSEKGDEPEAGPEAEDEGLALEAGGSGAEEGVSADTDTQGRSVSQVIKGEHLEQMGVFATALRDGLPSAQGMVELLMRARLARLTLNAKHLLCAALVDEDQEVILGWHHDACTRVILEGDVDAFDILIVAELAQSLVNGDSLVTAEITRMMEVAVDHAKDPENSAVLEAGTISEEPRAKGGNIRITTSDPKVFVTELMRIEVPETTPNSSGVYVNPPAVELRSKNLRVRIELAVQDGRWATGYHYDGSKAQQLGGGALPSANGSTYQDRWTAIAQEIDELKVHLNRKEYAPLVTALEQAAEVLISIADAPPSKEALYDCEKCGGKGFTKRGLGAHKCERRQEKAVKGLKVNQPRVPNPEAEEIGWQTYLRTGSLKEAALKAKVSLNTIKTWMKPPCKSRPSGRGWKARREAELAKK